MSTRTPATPAPLTAPTNGAAALAAAERLHAGALAAPAPSDRPFARHVWALARLSIGWVFLWAFLDKTFGLGHETSSSQAWIHGGNPTDGFLSGAVGPFAGPYHDIAGTDVVNVLFMLGLLAIGAALMLGVAMWPACLAGAAMVILMWSASLPPSSNLFMDDHLIYALLLLGLAAVGAGTTLGLAGRWAQTGLVRRYPWLA